MVWFARPLLGYAIYLPAAAAVLLLPWINTEYDCVGTSPLAYHMGGAALLNAAVAAALTRAGVGMALLFAAWAGGGAAAALAIGVAGVRCEACDNSHNKSRPACMHATAAPAWSVLWSVLCAVP